MIRQGEASWLLPILGVFGASLPIELLGQRFPSGYCAEAYSGLARFAKVPPSVSCVHVGSSRPWARAVTIGGLVVAIGKFSGCNESVAFRRAAIGGREYEALQILRELAI